MTRVPHLALEHASQQSHWMENGANLEVKRRSNAYRMATRLRAVTVENLTDVAAQRHQWG
jgi:hypothetical protein